MQTALYLAAALIALVSFAHSYLGERYILIRLFRRTDLPNVLGGTEFTKRTLRFAWHVTSVAWLGLAAVLLVVARGPGREREVLAVVTATFAVHCAIALFGSRGRHLSWIAFLIISALGAYAAVTWPRL